MGTSTAYGGPGGGTPLVPSWLGGADGGEAPAAPAGTGAGPDGQPPADGGAPPVPPNRLPIPRTADPQRFSGARNCFTRFAGSGGTDRANLGRAVSRYVSTSAGGARQAAQRMGASRSAGARLLGFLTGDVGGLFGAGVVTKSASPEGAETFINRGGHIPAPIHSLMN